ncbi:DUF6864 domain-containing function [Pseudomonas salomonii]|uniref:Uncharacterized protein n=1 Tax=Pseudomonas salomonii TaxID=191391 RepID=A0ABS9GQE8_9PSED|nr:hypothetical protein [Pseudomonas salomonii]MCF5547760.1 hypothetical protein [Pseudomonas salomonii]
MGAVKLEVRAIINGLDVVASGIVHVVGPSITLMLDSMPVEIVFISDSLGLRYTSETVGASVRISLYNFSTIGDGMVVPVSIATSDGRPVYITFWVNTINAPQLARELRYTILMGPKFNA